MTPEEKRKEYLKQYHKNYKRSKEKRKEYYNANKDKIKEKANDYYKNNKIKRLEYQKEYIKSKDKEKINEYQREYKKIRTKNDPLFKLTRNIGNLIRHAIKIKNYKKQTKTELILGCSFQDFKEHLESQFESWMTWDNYGLYNGSANYGWDIDHITPTSSATTEDEVIKLNHFSNLQPLCSYFNRDVKKNN